jgi:hypothetical protein
MSDPCEDLNVALVSIPGIASGLARNLIALSSQNEMHTALSNQILAGSVLSSLPKRLYTCYICVKEQGDASEEGGEEKCEKSREHPWSSDSSMVEGTVKAFIQTGAICQEVLVRQAQVSAMIRCAWWDSHIAHITDYSAQICSTILSMNVRAISIIGESDDPRLSIQGETLLRLIPGHDEDNISRDLLGRSILHQLLDEHPDPGGIDMRLKGFQSFETESLYQVQDRLGRTLLHLLCQKGSYRAVTWSLQMGADPSATTVYGHLPLHYAAKRADYAICELLLSCKKSFNIEQKDQFEQTAYDYAVREDHRRVKSLLKDAGEKQRRSRMSSDDSI